MPAPTSSVDVCNLALDYLHETPISSIESPSNQKEELCARWYDLTRQSLLRQYCWNFANKYTTLNRSGDGEGGYEDKYTYPNDFIRLNLVGEDRDFPITDFDTGENCIFASNGASLPIRYNRDVTTVSRMDATFIEILALSIAENIAYKVTQKKSVEEKVSNMLATKLPKAVGVDGQERPPRRYQRSKYLAARRFGGSLSQDNRYYNFGDS